MAGTDAWLECTICRELPEAMHWCLTARGEFTGEYLPATTEQFEKFWGLWKCRQCNTFYEYEHEHDNGIPDGWDSEDLRRISADKALEKLRALDPEPRVEREIATLTRP